MSVLVGCPGAGPPSKVFTGADLQMLQTICEAPPFPSSYSGLTNQAQGHLRQVLSARSFLSADRYIENLKSDTLETLKGTAALVVLRHRASKVPAGVLVLLFDPEATGDVFQVQHMLDPTTITGMEGPPLRAYPLTWYQADADVDYVQDSLFHMDLGAQAGLVNAEGEPQYEYAWGEP